MNIHIWIIRFRLKVGLVVCGPKRGVIQLVEIANLVTHNRHVLRTDVNLQLRPKSSSISLLNLQNKIRGMTSVSSTAILCL